MKHSRSAHIFERCACHRESAVEDVFGRGIYAKRTAEGPGNVKIEDSKIPE